jgi:dipeptidyl-peptidase 4
MTGTAPYPQQAARTRRFSLGLPRGWTAHPDGVRLRYLMSRDGRDPVQCLWELATDTGKITCLVDPRELSAPTGGDADAERARRERARELASGITAYDVDQAGSRIVFTVEGSLYLAETDTAKTAAVGGISGVFDPRISPDGRSVLAVVDDALQHIDLDTMRAETLVQEVDVRWGSAEFVAAEEMGRSRGYWWAPDSAHVLAARVDERGVDTWYIADPAQPAQPPRQHAYPAAGRPNADVQLAIVSTADKMRLPVTWDRRALPYLVNASWDVNGSGSPRLSIVVQSRDQRRLVLLDVDRNDGSTDTRWQAQSEVPIELVPGAPVWAGEHLVTVDDNFAVDPPSRMLVIDGTPVTPPGLQVDAVVDVTGDQVTFRASEDPTVVDVWQWTPQQGTVRIAGTGDGVTSAAVCGPWLAVTHSDLSTPDVQVDVRNEARSIPIAHRAERPCVTPAVTHLIVGARDLRVALVMPPDLPNDGPVPVILDPYGGPHAQRVLASARAYLTSQWFANHGFAVVVADGRGTPGRGPAWERAVYGDLATGPLEDQLDALDAVAARQPRLDMSRVGIRGWSFGGYLAALAATRAPDRIRAASCGAPVVDWRLYDTHYTERYLGHPDDDETPYLRSNVIGPEVKLDTVAANLRPAIQIMHGLADDNVVVAHALRLSQALLLAGWDHEFIPLSGVTHFTTQEELTARLLERELAFFQRALGVPAR